MHFTRGTRALALTLGLLVAATAPALAQDTTEMGGAPMDTMTHAIPPSWRRCL